jgi:hypothetical protein
MRSKSLKKVGSSVPKGYGRSEMFSDVGLSSEPMPYDADTDDEESSTGTMSDPDDEKVPPALITPVATRRKKVPPPSMILQEETDFVYPVKPQAQTVLQFAQPAQPIKNSNPRLRMTNTEMMMNR